MHTSFTVRLTAAAASVVTTLAMLAAVVSLGEPTAEGASQQLAAVAAPAAR
ncbi:MAG: hypothetical protein JNL87_02610 [Burkholderiaceae bacterium]|nr:hypothetical protein [Burkholderiaceae bacterium]